MKIIIPSRGRPENVSHTNILFPSASWCIAQSEVDTYHKAGAKDIMAHPDTLIGLGPKRQWILDNVSDPVVVQIDDDIKYASCVVGIRSRPIFDPAAILAILEGVATCARDAGATVFGFAQGNDDVRKFKPNKPFAVIGWVGTVIGVIGRKIKFDTTLKSRVDIDFCLKCMDRDRMIWRDNRFTFVNTRIKNKGGSQGLRTADSDRAEINRLKQRWGRNITVTESVGEILIKLNALRS